MTTPRQRQKEITDIIESAQAMLSEAAQLACGLGGWSEQWKEIERTHDAVKALWYRIDQSPPPKP